VHRRSRPASPQARAGRTRTGHRSSTRLRARRPSRCGRETGLLSRLGPFEPSCGVGLSRFPGSSFGWFDLGGMGCETARTPFRQKSRPPDSNRGPFTTSEGLLVMARLRAVGEGLGGLLKHRCPVYHALGVHPTTEPLNTTPLPASSVTHPARRSHIRCSSRFDRAAARSDKQFFRVF
jgi:hypothetical protein